MEVFYHVFLTISYMMDQHSYVIDLLSSWSIVEHSEKIQLVFKLQPYLTEYFMQDV